MKKQSRGILLSYLYFALNAISSIFLSAYVIRMVGSTDYGVYQTMTSFVSYLILLEFGTGTLIMRNMALCRNKSLSQDDTNRNFSTIFTLTLILSILLIAFSGIFFFNIRNIYHNTLSEEQLGEGKIIFIFASLNLLINFINQSFNGALLALENYSFEKIINLSKLFVKDIVVIFLLLVVPNVYVVVLVDLILSISCFLITFLFFKVKTKIKFSFRLFDKKIFRESIPFLFGMFLQTVVNTVNCNVDKFIIGVTIGPNEVAIYSIAMSMFVMFSSIATLTINMYMPKLAKVKDTNSQEAYDIITKACRLNIIVTGIILCGFILVGKTFISLVYGEEFNDAWLCSLLIMVPLFFDSFNGVIIDIVQVKNKLHLRSIILCGIVLINICLTIPLLKAIGIVGAALATGISLLLQIVVMNIFYKKVLGIKILFVWRSSFKNLFLVLVIATFVSYCFCSKISNPIAFFISCGGTLVIISILFLFLFGFNETEKRDAIIFLGKVFKHGKQ